MFSPGFGDCRTVVGVVGPLECRVLTEFVISQFVCFLFGLCIEPTHRNVALLVLRLIQCVSKEVPAEWVVILCCLSRFFDCLIPFGNVFRSIYHSSGREITSLKL